MPATAEAPTLEANRKFKMKLVNAEFNIDFGGRLPAGAVVLVDEPTAIRWYERGVAEIADPGEETYAEHHRRVKRDEFLRRARPAEGVFDRAVSLQPFRDDPAHERTMREMPKPSRGRRRADDMLAGASVNDLDDDE